MPNKIVEYPYKIHALESVDAQQTYDNGVYYATEDEALERCHSYLQAPGQASSGFVIFKAHIVVRPEARPVRVNRIKDDGSIGETEIVDDMDFLRLDEGEES